MHGIHEPLLSGAALLSVPSLSRRARAHARRVRPRGAAQGASRSDWAGA